MQLRIERNSNKVKDIREEMHEDNDWEKQKDFLVDVSGRP